MPARKVKTFKKELGHRMHRDHRTHRRPISKRQAALTRQFRKRKEELQIAEQDRTITFFLKQYAKS